MPAPLLPKYLRLRRESQSAELAWNHRQRLARELAQLEGTFVEMGLMPFADTQPCEHFNLDAEISTASTPTCVSLPLVGLAS